MSMLFAATYPERTQALLLVGAEVKEETTEDWPWGESTREEFDAYAASIGERWGKGLAAALYFPDDPDPEWTRRWFGKLQTASMTPRDALAFQRMAFEIDVRDVVPAVRVPTLIVHRVDDTICHVENARFLADRIPGARYVELPGSTHIPWAEGSDEILAEIREFLTGVREAPEPDRVLTTVLFTDIVGSTGLATELGDRRWRELLQAHHAAIRRELERFRGHEIDTAGDGFLASLRRSCAGDPLRRRSDRRGSRPGTRYPCRPPHGRVRDRRRQARGDRRPHRRARGRRGRARRGARLEHGARPGRRVRAGVRGPRRGRAEGRAGRVAPLPRQRRLLSSRSMRRLLSRSAMSRRLSRSSFPRPSASSTFARPFLK